MNLIAEDTSISREEVYEALVRSLRRRKGFGIVFVQCSPAEATRLIEEIQGDLIQKQFANLNFDAPIDNLYDLVTELPNRENLNILFIQGLEKSLEPYIKPGYGGDGDYYNLDTVPPILSHLNQRRELFRDDFHNICFVFFLPLFAIKYIIRRSPDLFDWSAGVFEFLSSIEQLDQESQQILLEGVYKKYCDLTLSDRTHKILKIQEMIGELKQDSSLKAKLLVEQGNLFTASSQYEDAIASYKEALNIQQENYVAWHNRGYALGKLGRHQEAIVSYNKAIKIKPDFYLAWQDRGDSLIELGQDQEASVSYEVALFNAEFEILLAPKNRLNNVLYLSIKVYLYKFDLKGMDVDEIINEIYIRGSELIRSGNEIKHISTWIRKTAYEVIREISIKKHLDRKKGYEIFPIDSFTPEQLYQLCHFTYEQLEYNPYLHTDITSEMKIIEIALQKLDEESQNLVRLLFIEGLSQSEIGKRLGVPQYAVSRKMHKALNSLRVALKE